MRGTESLALSVLRIMEEESIKDNTGQIEAQLPVNVATYLLNEKRRSVRSIEKNHSVQLVIIPNPNMETPQYSISRRRPDETSQEMSYNLPLIEQEETITDKTVAPAMAKEQPALQSLIAPNKSAKTPTAEKTTNSEGLLAKISKWFSELFKEEPKEVPKKNTHTRNKNNNQRKGRNPRNDRNKRHGKNHDRNGRNEQSSNRNERSERKPRNDNRKPRRNDKQGDVTTQSNQNNDTRNNAPAKKKEQVAERRKRRDTRRSVRVEAETKDENVNVEAVETQVTETATSTQATLTNTAPVDTSATQVETPIADQAEDTNASSDEEKPRTRSRRSPRHIRAAGQKRRQDTDENNSTDVETTEAKPAPVVEPKTDVKQDELQFDEPTTAETAKEAPQTTAEAPAPEQVSLALSNDEPKAIEPKVDLADATPAVVVDQPPAEKTKKQTATKKATSLKVATKVKSKPVSAPMARPATIDDEFIDINIGSLSDDARPEVKRSAKTAAFLSATNQATAPAFRPGADA